MQFGNLSRVGLITGSILGKCNFCNNKVQQDNHNVCSKFAVMHNAKWLCGDCIVGMSEMVAHITKEAVKHRIILDAVGVPEESDFIVDTKTGKLVPATK
tara:strand:+ start:2152 stop:2448 length:297 start_codon:yes stop_codon:yes gene_type:complete